MTYCPNCMSEIADNTAQCPHCRGKVDIQNEEHQLRPMTILNGKYIVGKVLGEGGFGVTYIGYDLNLHSTIAVKEYYPSGLINRISTYSTTVKVKSKDTVTQFEKGRERFLEEAQIIYKFKSDPNIVDVRDFFYENGTAYIVMEYIDGVSLGQYIKQNGPIKSFNELYRMLRPVLLSLSHVHKAGLIHRDISPSNLMIDSSGTVKLLDFGTARAISEDGEKSLSVVLKHGFAPMEQYQSHGRQGAWTDVYALCATMYKLLTGKTPTSAMDRLSEEMPVPSALGAVISQKQEKILLQGMAVQITDRIQNVEELIKLFDSTVGMQNQDEISDADKKRPKAVRRIIAAVLAAALCISFFAFGVPGKMRKKPPQPTVSVSPVIAEETSESASAPTPEYASALTPAPTPIPTPIPTPEPLLTEGRGTDGSWLSNITYNPDGQINTAVESGVEWMYVYSDDGNFRYRMRQSKDVPTLGSSSGHSIPGTDITYKVLSYPVENCAGFSFDYRINYFKTGSMDGDRWVYAAAEPKNAQSWKCVGRFEYDVYEVDMKWHEVTIMFVQPQTLSAFGTPRVNSDNYSVFDNDHAMKAVWIADYNNVQLQKDA